MGSHMYCFGFFPPGGTTTRVLNHMAANIVAVDSHTNPRMVQIHLKKSKCDQFGQGQI